MNKIIKSSKGLISVFEITFLFILFFSSITYFGILTNHEEKDYKFNIESSLDTLYFYEQNRVLFMEEDLSNLTTTGNWTNISNILNSIYLNYELVISNNSISKKIFSCNSSNEKYYTERIISIENNEIYEFRKIKLGVCY